MKGDFFFQHMDRLQQNLDFISTNNFLDKALCNAGTSLLEELGKTFY